MDAIYLVRDGQQTGPFTRAQIDAMLASGEATPDTMAWYDGLPNWAALSTIVGSSSVPAVPPAPAPAVATVTPGAVVPSDSGYTTAELYHLGKCQAQFLQAFLVNIVANVISRFVNNPGLIEALVFLAFVVVVVGFVMYTAVRLAKALRFQTFQVVLLCIGLLVPCVSLIIMLVLISRSSKILKAAGIKIGLMGPKMDDLKP